MIKKVCKYLMWVSSIALSVLSFGKAGPVGAGLSAMVLLCGVAVAMIWLKKKYDAFSWHHEAVQEAEHELERARDKASTLAAKASVDPSFGAQAVLAWEKVEELQEELKSLKG